MNTEDLDATTVELSVDGAVYKIVMPDMASDYIQNRVATELEPYELEMLRDMKSRLSATDLVLDIGANIGNHTFYLAEVVGCKVVAFEPNESLVAAMQQSVQLNNNSNRVVIESCALGEESNICEFEKLIPENIGSQKIVCGHGDMQVRTLDEFTFNEPVKMLKIDVEGMELEVLKGAKKLIACDAPIIYVEALELSDFEVLHGFFADLEYTYLDTFNATPTHVFVPASKLNLSGDMFKSSHFKSASKSYDIRSLQGKYKNVSILNASLNESLSREKLKRSAEQSGLQEESEKRRFKLDEANKKYKGLCENYTDLKKNFEKAELRHKKVAVELEAEIEQKNSACNEKDRELDRLQSELVNHTLELGGAKSACNEKDRELDRLQSELVNHTLELGEAKSACNEKDRELDRLQSELVNHTLELGEAKSACNEKDRELGQLKLEMESQRLKTKTISEDHKGLQNRLDKANSAYRNVTGSLNKLKVKHQDSLNVYAENGLRWLEPMANLVGPIPSLSRYVARRCTRLAKSHYAKDDFAQLFLASLACKLDPKPYRAKWYGFRLHKSGLSLRAKQVLDEVRGNVIFSASEERVYGELSAQYVDDDSTKQRDADFDKVDKKKIKVATLDFKRPIAELTVACVVDEFSYHSFSPECNLIQLSPTSWMAEVAEALPDMLLVESAWRGLEGQWAGKVGHNSTELKEVLNWCQQKRIPTAFWNKEDPVHFSGFLNTAAQFDYVFTTDIDCIADYKAVLKHDRVYLLPFACQPKMHNPIESYKRKDAFSFAGAYYQRYPERTADLEDFIRYLPGFKPVEIYDRNYGGTEAEHQFPSEFQEYIVGTLPFSEIERAYKGYYYAINLNSIKHSQSMFARRVFELLASNTITVSNFSRGIKTLFGDLVFSSDSGLQNMRQVVSLEESPANMRKYRLAGLRKVLAEHTYKHRLQYLMSRMASRPMKPAAVKVTVLARAQSVRELQWIEECFERQKYENKNLVLLMDGDFKIPARELASIRYVYPAQLDLDIEMVADEADYVACFSAKDYYGANYILDLVLSFSYFSGVAAAKGTYYEWSDSKIDLKDEESRYTLAKVVSLRSAMFRATGLSNNKLLDWFRTIDDFRCEVAEAINLDEFNYCRNGSSFVRKSREETLTRVVDDLVEVDGGQHIDDLLLAAEKISASKHVMHDDNDSIPALCLSKLFVPGVKSKIQSSVKNEEWRLISKLADGEHEYIYQKDYQRISEVAEGQELPLHLQVSPGLNVRFVVIFFDVDFERLAHDIIGSNQNNMLNVPLKAVWLRFGLRIYGGGSAAILNLIFSEVKAEPRKIISDAQHLVLTNHYPSYDDIYRNGFVHSRVAAYQRAGMKLDVFRLVNTPSTSFHDFEGVSCITGPSSQLDSVLSSGRYKTVLVHFLEEQMWDVLLKYVGGIRVIVWLHGAEIQPYHRREYNYSTDNERANAKVKSEQRMKFWRGLLKEPPKKLELVFVSQYFADEVMDDLGFPLANNLYKIIHNPVNTDIFHYIKKSANQRFKLLSIRPYASNKYANDLTVKMILELSNESWFEKLDILLVGDGALFEATLEPVRDFENVKIEKRFMKHNEISEIHKNYGIFITPTRMDAQGVSRDEAMSSGLVPITNAVTAIPEFVDESTGILAPGEDYMAMADGVRRLVNAPSLFCAMSEAAASRVRSQLSYDQTLGKEMDLIKNKGIG